MKILLALIVLGMIAVIVVYIMIVMTMRRVLRAGAKVAIEAAWRKVGGHDNAVLRIVEADKVLDEALRLLGYEGSLGEKLRSAGPRFGNLNAVWSAHKLRNKVVHELDAKPGDREIDAAVASIRSALTDLGARL